MVYIIHSAQLLFMSLAPCVARSKNYWLQQPYSQYRHTHPHPHPLQLANTHPPMNTIIQLYPSLFSVKLTLATGWPHPTCKHIHTYLPPSPCTLATNWPHPTHKHIHIYLPPSLAPLHPSNKQTTPDHWHIYVYQPHPAPIPTHLSNRPHVLEVLKTASHHIVPEHLA